MPLGFKMAEAKWLDIEKAFKENFPIIIPLGAGCKEHGYHLPMNTDQIIADYLAQWVMLNNPVLIAPTITYNFFPAFEEYQGSATLSFATSFNTIVDLCTNWHSQGAQQFYVLNTGLSTNKVLAKARETLIQQDIAFFFSDFSALHKHERIKKITQQTVGTHADEIETSIMLYIKPETVDLSLAIPEENPDKTGSLTRNVEATDKTISLSGAWGNPTLASADKGQIAIDVLQELIQHDLEQLTFPKIN